MKDKPLIANHFRQQAEDLLKDKPTVSMPLHTEADILKLIHEIEIHQLEPELQNGELIKASKGVQDAVGLNDVSPTGYFTLSIDGRITGLNLSGANMLQLEKKNVLGSLFGEFVREDTTSVFNDFLEQIFKNKTIQTCEIALKVPSNASMNAKLTGVLNDNREFCLITAINTTEYKQQEEKLNHERELYQDIVNNQPAGIYRIRVLERDKWWDKSWKSSENPPFSMELASDRFCEILGITREEFEINPAIIADLIHPDDKSGFAVKNEDANAFLITFQWEGRLIVQNKPIWVHLESIPRPMASGEVLWTGILYDITDQKQGEAALKESENKYRKLVDNSPDAISIYSDGKIVFVNNACIDLMKASGMDDLLGKNVIDFVHPAYRQIVFHRMKDLAHNGKALPTEDEKFIQLDGSIIDVEVKAMSIVFQNKPSVQLIIREITDRKRAEKEIAKSKEDFKDLFDNAPVGYHEIDSQGRIVRINQTELTMLGYSPEDLIGQYIWKYNTNKNLSFEITREKLQGRQILSTPYERELIRKDGSKITVLQFDRVLRAKDGSITGIRSSVQDITERKQAEINLQLSEEKFRNVFENSVVGKSMTAIDGQMKVNKAFSNIMGYSEEELSHMKWIDLTYKDDIEFNQNEIQSILHGEKDFSQWEKRYIHKNGNIIWANISIFLQRDNAGNPIHFITEIFDITNTKKSETDLRNSEEKFKKAFMTSPDSVTISRMEDGVYVSINIGFTRILGYQQDDILGKTSLEINIWEKHEDRERLVTELNKKGIVENFITQFKAKSGETVYGMMSASVIELEGVNHILSITRDVTAIKKTEQELQQSQERFKVLFEDAPDTMFLADPETGKIIDANTAACRLFKMKKEELVGQYQHKLHPKEHTEISIAAFKDHIIQSEIQDFTTLHENRIVCSDGTEIPVEILAHSITIDNRVLLLGTFRDISERKKAEAALRESEELYHDLVLRIPDGVYKSTADGKFIDVNPAMVKMFGYESKDELLNIDITTQLYFDPADREHILPDGQKDDISVLPLKKKDGSVIWIEDHGWYNADLDGKVVTHEGVLRDITERKLAQDALRESEDKHRTMIENSNDMIWTLDKQGNFTFLNKVALKTTGLEIKEWIGRSFSLLILDEDLSMITDIFNRTMHGEVCTYELRFKKTDETILTILVNTSPIYISEQIVGVVSFGRDITESKESLRLLLESEEKFRSITEQTGDLISITDPNGIILYASNASKSIFQYEPDEMCGHNFTHFLEEKSIPEALTVFKDGKESVSTVRNKELNMKRKDGSIFCGELNGSKFKNGDNNGTLVVIRDMSERKKVQEELEEKMNELIRFQNLTVDREITMIELKKEVNELLLSSGKKLKYKIVK